MMYFRGSIGQSSFVCQVWCSGIQGIYAQLPGGSISQIGSSAKFGVVVFKASILNYPGESIGQRSTVTTILHITHGKYEPS